MSRLIQEERQIVEIPHRGIHNDKKHRTKITCIDSDKSMVKHPSRWAEECIKYDVTLKA